MTHPNRARIPAYGSNSVRGSNAVTPTPTLDRPIVLGDCRHWWQPLPDGIDPDAIDAIDGVLLATLRERFPAGDGRIAWWCTMCGRTTGTIVVDWKAVIS
ncbi:MAG TPA: hypothetical protein VF178_00815 [Gemmatimonadaceae bacterium]